jgi:hypothetical protein
MRWANIVVPQIGTGTSTLVTCIPMHVLAVCLTVWKSCSIAFSVDIVLSQYESCAVASYTRLSRKGFYESARNVIANLLSYIISSEALPL